MMPENMFISVLNLSIKGSWVILAVLVLRLLFQRLPKKYMCVLWAIAGIRLIIPFSFQSFFSLMPAAEPIPHNIALMKEPAVHTGFEAVDHTVNPVITQTFAPAAADSANPLQIITFIAGVIWIIGMIVMLAYLAYSWLNLRKITSDAKETEPGIYEGKMISAPFVSGIIRPAVYLPLNLNEDQRNDILAHEKMHIARFDIPKRMIAYLILAVHWFNPLVWLAWHLFCTDIELACDEAVISSMDPDMQKHYARTILDCAYHKNSFALMHASFDATDTKKRIRNLIRWKRPTLTSVLAALCLCTAVGCGMLSDPKADYDPSAVPQETEEPEAETLSMEKSSEYNLIHLSSDRDLIEKFRSLFSELSQYSSSDNQVIVQKDPFESIPDVILTSGPQTLFLLRYDFSRETQNENMKDAWYAEMFENGKRQKGLIINAACEYGAGIESIVTSMDQQPSVNRENNIPEVTYMISLIETETDNVYCLKEEMIYPKDHYLLESYDSTKIRSALGNENLKISEASDYPSASAIREPAENEIYAMNSCYLIEMNEEQKEALFDRLTTCMISMSFLNTDTEETISFEVNPSVSLVPDSAGQ